MQRTEIGQGSWFTLDCLYEYIQYTHIHMYMDIICMWILYLREKSGILVGNKLPVAEAKTTTQQQKRRKIALNNLKTNSAHTSFLVGGSFE